MAEISLGVEGACNMYIYVHTYCEMHMGQVPQDGNFAQNVALFCKK